MKKNRSDVFIALGVLACSAVLLAALVMAFSGWSPRSAGRTVEIDFLDVTGIREHSQVRYAGAPAGTVARVRLLSDGERSATNWSAVRVSVRLFESTPALPDDVRASLSSDTLLGDKFIALSSGSPDRPKLPDGAVLLGASGGSFDSLIESVPQLVASVDRTLRGLDGTVAKTGAAVDSFKNGMDDVLPRIAKLADSLKETSEAATAALAKIDKLVAEADPAIKEDLRKLSQALDDLGGTLDSADKLIGNTDRQIAARMGELSVVLQNLKVASTHAKALTKSLGEKPNRIIFSGKPVPLPSEQEILRSVKPVPVR